MSQGYRSRGPGPKREDERVRRHEPTVTTTKIDLAKLDGEVEMPAADEAWHSVAKMWYTSLSEGAQCVFFEPTDWAIAYVMATNLSRQLKPQFVGFATDEDGTSSPHTAVKPLSGADMAAFLKGCTNLLMTEVDRRRAGIEINRAAQLGNVDESSDDGVVVDFRAAREASVQG